jgi:hypothetical protein
MTFSIASLKKYCQLRQRLVYDVETKCWFVFACQANFRLFCTWSYCWRKLKKQTWWYFLHQPFLVVIFLFSLLPRLCLLVTACSATVKFLCILMVLYSCLIYAFLVSLEHVMHINTIYKVDADHALALWIFVIDDESDCLRWCLLNWCA